MKREVISDIKCLFCGKHCDINVSCSCYKENSVLEDDDLKRRVFILEAESEELTRAYLDLDSKYELLLNRIKCIECSKCINKKDES